MSSQLSAGFLLEASIVMYKELHSLFMHEIPDSNQHCMHHLTSKVEGEVSPGTYPNFLYYSVLDLWFGGSERQQIHPSLVDKGPL